MTIYDSFVKFLENKGYGIFGQNIFLFRVPSTLKLTDEEILWIIPSGGQVVGSNRTGETIRAYQFSVYYRSKSTKKVAEVLTDLNELFNCSNCVELEGFELLNMRTTQFPIDQDLDSEKMEVGFVSVELEIYKGCN